MWSQRLGVIFIKGIQLLYKLRLKGVHLLINCIALRIRQYDKSVQVPHEGSVLTQLSAH